MYPRGLRGGRAADASGHRRGEEADNGGGAVVPAEEDPARAPRGDDKGCAAAGVLFIDMYQQRPARV